MVILGHKMLNIYGTKSLYIYKAINIATLYSKVYDHSIHKLTDNPKCSRAPRPVPPSTPKDMLSSMINGVEYLLRNSTNLGKGAQSP